MNQNYINDLEKEIEALHKIIDEQNEQIESYEKRNVKYGYEDVVEKISHASKTQQKQFYEVLLLADNCWKKHVFCWKTSIGKLCSPLGTRPLEFKVVKLKISYNPILRRGTLKVLLVSEVYGLYSSKFVMGKWKTHIDRKTYKAFKYKQKYLNKKASWQDVSGDLLDIANALCEISR